MDYEDFSLKLEPKADNKGYRVLLLSSPAGQDKSFFNPQDKDPVFAQPLNALKAILKESRIHRSGVNEGTYNRPDPFWPSYQNLGDQLFRALFTANILAHFRYSLGALAHKGKGLRICIHLDPRRPELLYLLTLPWEFLYNAEENLFLNLDVKHPIIRFLDIPQPVELQPYAPPLKLLLIAPQPVNLKQLELIEEAEHIKKALSSLPDVTVEVLSKGVTREKVREKLRSGSFHAIHFLGHGGTDKASKKEGLYLEDEEKNDLFINGEELALLLRGFTTLRFVFLNACQYTIQGDVGDPSPFSRLSCSLLLSGIPAVITTQFPIKDKAAVLLSKTFYNCLARGEPIDMALAEARQAVYMKNPIGLDWAAPVLYLRKKDGHIFPAPKENERPKTQKDHKSLKEEGKNVQLINPSPSLSHKTTKYFIALFMVIVLGGWFYQNKIRQVPLNRQYFRKQPILNYGLIDLERAISLYGFYERDKNPQTAGVENQFTLSKDKENRTIHDERYELTWQEEGSPRPLNPELAGLYISKLNNEAHAGFTNWRIPTMEELMSLLEREPVNERHINELFGARQFVVYTSDRREDGGSWFVDFKNGRSICGLNLEGYVRAVR